MSAELLKIVPEIEPGKKVAFTLGDTDLDYCEGEYVELSRLGPDGQPAHKVKVTKSNPGSPFKVKKTYYFSATHAHGEDDTIRPPVEMRILED
ncbi:MAG: hypothetical protein Q8P89_04880 [bacterium]|nr:hypothetical protein [bacterium]